MNALQGIALWLGLVAVFMIFWALLKAGAGQPEDDDPAGRDKGGPDVPPPPPSGA